MSKPNNVFFDNLIEEFNKIEAPDLKVQIKARYLLEKNNTETKAKLSHFNIRMLMNSLVASLAILIFAALIFIFNNQNTLPQYNNIDDENLVTFEAISSVSLMPSVITNNINNSSFSNYSFSLLKNETNSQDEVDKIHKYMFLVEQVLTVKENLKVSSQESDKVEYTNKDVIEIVSALNQNLQYTFYYNVTSTEDNKYNLIGVMLYNDTEYQLTGTKVVNENNIKVSIQAKYNENTWVIVEQNLINSQQVYDFTISDSGVISNSKMRLFSNKDKTEVELEYLDNLVTKRYRFKEEMIDNQQKIKIQVNEGKNTENFKVCIIKDDTTGEYVYQYKHEDKGDIIIKQNDKGHRGKEDAKPDEDNHQNGKGQGPNG